MRTFFNFEQCVQGIKRLKQLPSASLVSKIINNQFQNVNEKRIAIEILAFNMEEVCKRFPDLAENVIKKIDNQSLMKFKETNRNSNQLLDNGKVLWKRMILKHIQGK